MPDFTNSAQNAGNNNSTPSGIIISSINVWLPIYPSVIENGQWQTSRKGVSYLLNGVRPGEKGNAIFYGHNWPNLLGSLNRVKPGDSIQIVNLDGQTKTFTVSTVQEVTPNDTSVLSQTTDKRLTIYTCTGFLDSKRLVVVAQFTS
jgi:LPXTG-site transpeptidase (sortase) family protein